MPLLYHVTTTPGQMQAWRGEVLAAAQAAGQPVLYDGGCRPLVVAYPLGGGPALILTDDDPGLPLAERIADALAARSQLEDTRRPRRRLYLGLIYLKN